MPINRLYDTWKTQIMELRPGQRITQSGRFTQRDPFPGVLSWPDTLNPYPYVLNNPPNLVNPSGEFFIALLAAGIVGGFLGGVGYYTLQVFLNADPCLDVDWSWREGLLPLPFL